MLYEVIVMASEGEKCHSCSAAVTFAILKMAMFVADFCFYTDLLTFCSPGYIVFECVI